MKLGIIQGRLLPPIDNKIQEFPEKNWKEEFEKIKQIGLSHIEFIVTKNSFKKFLNLSLSEYSSQISGICCDNLIDNSFYKSDFLNDNLVPICDLANACNIKNINIPLLEQSSLNNDNVLEFSENIMKISNRYSLLNFNFEIESTIENALKIVNLSERFFFIYDTGNLNFIGVNHKDYIDNIINKISMVHLKDRDIYGSHFPGKGTTNFKLIFSILKKYNYSKYFTIQTKRGDSFHEKETISNHSRYFKTLWQDETINQYE